MRKSSKISMKSFYLSLLLFILIISGCNCWDIADGELEHDGGHTIWRIKNPKDTSIYDAVADTETYDVVDASGLEDVEDTGLDVEEMIDYEADLGVDVIDIGDSDQFDVEDGGGDVIEDVWDGGGDGGDISDVGDVCIPDCNGKECGSDGCGGVCGVCGMSAYCSNFKCICNTGYANCDNDWGNGCEIYLNSVKSCGTSCEDITNCGRNGECVFGVCKCKGMYENCDGLWSNGCETNLTNDVDNCGGCGRVCNNPPSDYCLNSTTLRDYTGVSSCQNSQCVYEYQDINCPNGCANGRCQSCTPSCAGKECGPDGCGGSCGFCGNNSICSNNKCVCKTGYANCNNDFSDGCEINKNTDVNNCGSCRNSCGVNAICSNGSCVCNSGYANCDNDWGNGCEKQLDPKHIWSKRFGGRDDDWGYLVSVDNSDNVYITGTFWSSMIDFGEGIVTNAGVRNIFLAKFDGNGNNLWSKSFGGSNWDEALSVSVDSLGNVYITGNFCSSTIDFGGGALTNAGGSCVGYPCPDIFLAKFDSNGNHIWSKSFGVGEWDKSNSVSVDSLGNVYGIGYFYGSSIDFGGCPLSSAGRQDIYLIKYAP